MSRLTKWGKRRSYAPSNIGEQTPPDDIKMLLFTDDDTRQKRKRIRQTISVQDRAFVLNGVAT